MLTLYYSPGACSLASHIALLEYDIPFNAIKVDLKTHTTEEGKDFYTISTGKGYVPVITLDNGEILTEGSAILYYLSKTGTKNGASTDDSVFGPYRLQEALTFVSSELHKTLGAYFNPKLPDLTKEATRAKLTKTFNLLDKKLAEQPYIAGEEFTVADAYCYTILRWMSFLNVGLSLSDWPNINAYFDSIGQRPKVQQALQQEGLV